MSTPLTTVVWKLPDGSTIEVTGTHNTAPPATTPPVTDPPATTPDPPVTTPPPATAYQPTLPANIAARLDLTKPLIDETFPSSLQWNTTWAKTWFGGNAFNQQPLDPNLVQFVTGGGLSLGVSNGGKTGCLVTSNPSNGSGITGFTYVDGYDETDAIIPIGGAWPSIWTDGQNWPADGENDTFELLGGGTSPTSNYHSGGPNHSSTDQPQNSGTIPGSWLGKRVKYGLLRTHDNGGTSYSYWDGQLVKQRPTYDQNPAHYLLLSIGDHGRGGNGPMIVYRRTVWALKA